LYKRLSTVLVLVFVSITVLVTILLSQNPNPNLDIQNIDGDTGLHLAVYSKNKDLVFLLVLLFKIKY
jgi:ankyrin repeat protein